MGRTLSEDIGVKWTLLLGPLSAIVKRIPSDSLRDKIGIDHLANLHTKQAIASACIFP